MKLLIFFLIAVIVFLLSPVPSHAKYHPGIKWREISADPFIVVFPKGYEETAAYTLETAQELYRRQIKFWGGGIRLHGPIRILLTDVYDTANGSATFYPYNRIELFLFNPPPDSTLGSYEEWVRLVLSHELTHIIHFNWGSGFTYFWRSIFGSNPVFFPAVVIPSWLLEGLAVYDESWVNRWGRLNSPDYYLMLKYIVKAGKMPDWTSIWGDPTPWPGATSIYLYGAAFSHFLEQKYGKEKLPQLVRHYARRPVPLIIKKKKGPVILSLQQRFKEVFGKDIYILWREFIRHLEHTLAEETPDPSHRPVRFLTSSGKSKSYPAPLDTHHVVYVDANYKEYPGLYILDTRTGKRKRLTRHYGINGWHYSRKQGNIYFSAADYSRSFYRYADLYTVNPQTGKTRRLSYGKRLFYPVMAHFPGDDSNNNKNDKPGNYIYNIIYCIKRIKMSSYLCRFDPATGKEELLSGGYDALAFPAISPDRRFIAVSLKQRGNNWRIALFDMKGRLLRFLTGGDVKSYYPRWSQNNSLYFIIQHRGSYRLAAADTERNTVEIYTGPGLPALKSFGLLPGAEDQQQVVASFFDANGFNLGTFNAADVKKETLPLDAGESAPAAPALGAAPPAPSSGGKRYNFLRELLPKYITPAYRKGGGEYQPGISIGGMDLTGEHSFTLDGYYGFDSGAVNGRVNYTFDGFYPTLGFTYSDLSGMYSTGDSHRYIHNEREFQFSIFYPLAVRLRRQLYLFYDVHFETVSDEFVDLPERFRYRLNGMKLALLFNSAQRYYDSISETDGISLSLSYSREFKFLGSDFSINTAALEYKHYISLGRPNVLALRLAASDSWGEAKRLVYMGGADSQTGFHVAGGDFFNLMRAYPSGYFLGAGGVLLNAEYRISLLKIEKVFFIFRSIERLYLSLFADVGNLWQEKIKIDPSSSLGAELNLVTYLGDIKLTIAGGAAVGQHPYHKALFYFRLGGSF
jgi:hypothetical protein